MSRTQTTTAAGYGTKHQSIRKQWAAHVEQGVIACARCHDRIKPGEPWDLGHHDSDRTIYTGPEHQRCNRSAAAMKKNGHLPPASYPRSRDW